MNQNNLQNLGGGYRRTIVKQVALNDDTKTLEKKNAEPVEETNIDLENLCLEEKIRIEIDSVLNPLKENLVQKLLDIFEEKSGPKCNVCRKDISGILYSCSECPEFYLCHCCEENESHDHDLIKKRHFNNENTEQVLQGGKKNGGGGKPFVRPKPNEQPKP